MGQKNREEQRGTVIDGCPRCGWFRPFAVVAHFRVSHIYYVPLGKGDLRAVVRRCLTCRAEILFDASRYSQILPNGSETKLSFEEALAASNAAASARLQAIASVEHATTLPAHRGNVDDPAFLHHVIGMLRALEGRGLATSAFLPAFSQWLALPSPDRNALAAAIETAFRAARPS